MPFELELDGKKYNTDYLSVAETVELETTLGKTWGQLNPLASAVEFKAFATICLRRDYPAEVAAKIAAELPLGTARKAARWIKDDLPDIYEDGAPKAEGGPSTTTSSGSPSRRGAGRRTSPADNPSAT